MRIRNSSHSAARRFMARLSIPFIAMLIGTGHVAAANPGTDGWQYELTPYLWASRMNGDIEAGPLPRTNVDMSFADILEVTDFAFMGAFEARKGRLGWLFDSMYMKTSDSATASRGGLSVTASLKLEQTLFAGAAAYRVVDGDVPMDIIGGVRYTNIDVDANINASLFGLTGRVSRSGDKDWIDPYIGMRVFYPLSEKWTAVGYADVGGFGVGSDFTWQGIAGLDYAYSETITAKFGYRYIGVDYDNDGFLYDMRNDGLYAGVGIRF